ncbi:hypothetical protein HYW46_07315 [Candidatus Daviesbacteria bacterium]|nr:hypothetical protein [Candidatus Daviesbacteria bacterium]
MENVTAWVWGLSVLDILVLVMLGSFVSIFVKFLFKKTSRRLINIPVAIVELGISLGCVVLGAVAVIKLLLSMYEEIRVLPPAEAAAGLILGLFLAVGMWLVIGWAANKTASFPKSLRH